MWSFRPLNLVWFVSNDKSTYPLQGLGKKIYIYGLISIMILTKYQAQSSMIEEKLTMTEKTPKLFSHV
jgi:hypothetical protein